jgi:PAS domain S-box-containing protein
VSSPRILIVEDERIVAKGLARTLENLGYRVAAIVSSGEAAVQTAEEVWPDLVLMDIMLEGPMNGIEAARRINSLFRIPVVYLSAHANKKLLEQAKVTQPYGYLSKPFSQQELSGTIVTALYKHSIDMRLKRSEERFRQIYDKAPVMMHSVDDRGIVRSVNDRWLDTLGYQRGEVIGMGIDFIMTPESGNKFRAGLPAFWKEGKGANLRYRYMRKDRSIADALLDSVVVHDPVWGRVILSVTRDITLYRGVDTATDEPEDIERNVRNIHDDPELPVFERSTELLEANRSKSEEISMGRGIEEAQCESEQRFRDLVDLLPQIVFEVDTGRKLTFVNRGGLEATGYNSEDIAETPNVLEYFIPEHREAAGNDLVRALDGERISGHEYSIRKKDGNIVSVVTYASPIVRDGRTVGVRGVAVDITDRTRAEDQLKDALAEKEIMIREIHHRVKNNLQVLSSMMQIQSYYLGDKSANEVFAAMEKRVRAMATAHEHLHGSPGKMAIDVHHYIHGLIDPLLRHYGSYSAPVEFCIDCEDASWDIDTAVVCGLLLNELVTNCLKHAFPGQREGRINIGLQVVEDRGFVLEVGDNGVGIPDHVDMAHPESLGLELVQILTDQLHGTVEIARNRGTRFTIRFSETGGIAGIVPPKTF